MFGLDIWKDIEGYEGKYQVSYCGEIRRIYENGKIRNLKTYKKHNKKDALFIGLNKKGVKREFLVHKLVAQAFLGKPKPGEVAYHKNGLASDNYASNIEYINRKALGKLTGSQSKRKGVVKIDETGEIVEVYKSAREAGRQNFMSYQTVIARCNNKVKSALAPDGYAYAWEDSEVSVKHAMKKLELLKAL